MMQAERKILMIGVLIIVGIIGGKNKINGKEYQNKKRGDILCPWL